MKKIKIPRNTSHLNLINNDGKHAQMTLKAFKGMSDKDFAETETVQIEFQKKLHKGFEIIGILNINKTDVSNGQTESTAQAVSDDIGRANGVAPASDTIVSEHIPDSVTASVPVWNVKPEDVAPISLRDPKRNILASFEYDPVIMNVVGHKTNYSILRCSDNGAIVGKPFADSYGLLNNGGFIGVIETIMEVASKQGLKPSVATTGSLMERERTFITLSLSEDAHGFKIGEREFHNYLACLNSIPSNAGCTVTFNNTNFCVCCRNTFAMALTDSKGSKFHAAIKHTKGMKAALSDIPVLLDAHLSGNRELFKQLKAFNVFPVSLEDAERFFAAFLSRDLKDNLTDKEGLSTRSANTVDTLKELFVNGKGNHGKTGLDLFSAATDFYSHLSAGETENKNKQFQSSEIGAGAIAKRSFYQWLVNAIQTKTNFQAIAKVGDTLLVNYKKKN